MSSLPRKRGDSTRSTSGTGCVSASSSCWYVTPGERARPGSVTVMPAIIDQAIASDNGGAMRTSGSPEDRTAIVDVTVAYCWALDTRDWTALDDVFLPDATAELASPLLTGVGAIRERVAAALTPLDETQHAGDEPSDRGRRRHGAKQLLPPGTTRAAWRRRGRDVSDRWPLRGRSHTRTVGLADPPPAPRHHLERGQPRRSAPSVTPGGLSRRRGSRRATCGTVARRPRCDRTRRTAWPGFRGHPAAAGR